LADFPTRPTLKGAATVLPTQTFKMLAVVATCASSDQTRQILNGVYFTPDDGGMLVATDGRRLAGAPAWVSTVGSFILPSVAVHILGHPDFGSRAATVTLSQTKSEGESGGGEDQLVSFQSQNHLLISRTLPGTYPNWREVVPREKGASLTISADRRPPLLTWLRSLRGQEGSVTLTRKKRGVLQLTHVVRGNVAATVEVPIEQSGELPPISLDPGLLATALSIAPTLWLTDSMSPVVGRRADGAFCVIMPMRLTGAPMPEAKPRKESSDQAAA
jgi:DNA polymerase III subunit beta